MFGRIQKFKPSKTFRQETLLQFPLGAEHDALVDGLFEYYGVQHKDVKELVITDFNEAIEEVIDGRGRLCDYGHRGGLPKRLSRQGGAVSSLSVKRLPNIRTENILFTVIQSFRLDIWDCRRKPL